MAVPHVPPAGVRLDGVRSSFTPAVPHNSLPSAHLHLTKRHTRPLDAFVRAPRRVTRGDACCPQTRSLGGNRLFGISLALPARPAHIGYLAKPRCHPTTSGRPASLFLQSFSRSCRLCFRAHAGFTRSRSSLRLVTISLYIRPVQDREHCYRLRLTAFISSCSGFSVIKISRRSNCLRLARRKAWHETRRRAKVREKQGPPPQGPSRSVLGLRRLNQYLEFE